MRIKLSFWAESSLLLQGLSSRLMRFWRPSSHKDDGWHGVNRFLHLQIISREFETSILLLICFVQGMEGMIWRVGCYKINPTTPSGQKFFILHMVKKSIKCWLCLIFQFSWCCLWSRSQHWSSKMESPWAPWCPTPPGCPPSGSRSGAPWRLLSSSRTSKRSGPRWPSTSSSITQMRTLTCPRSWATTTGLRDFSSQINCNKSLSNKT